MLLWCYYTYPHRSRSGKPNDRRKPMNVLREAFNDRIHELDERTRELDEREARIIDRGRHLIVVMIAVKELMEEVYYGKKAKVTA